MSEIGLKEFEKFERVKPVYLTEFTEKRKLREIKKKKNTTLFWFPNYAQVVHKQWEPGI